MTVIVTGRLTKQGNCLVGDGYRADELDKPRALKIDRPSCDPLLAALFDRMPDAIAVDVQVSYSPKTGRVASLAGPPPDLTVQPKSKPAAQVRPDQGFVNPYTFVPTPPRGDLASPAGYPAADVQGTGLADGEPPSHSRRDPGQWSGHLNFTMTTKTPLLLPKLDSAPGEEPKTYDLKLDHEGRPMIHGASLKGSLRSAFETITASRFGVFFDHELPLAYRGAPTSSLDLVPARVSDCGSRFVLCTGVGDWQHPTQLGRKRDTSTKAAFAASIPAYDSYANQLTLCGELSNKKLSNLNREELFARVILVRGRLEVWFWRVTHLAQTEEELVQIMPSEADEPPSLPPALTHFDEVPARIVAGWLSITGKSFKKKRHERLFVSSDRTIPITDLDRRMWAGLLESYATAARYHDIPKDLNESVHVAETEVLKSLPRGTLIYLELDSQESVLGIYPVLISRKVFPQAPASLLPDCLHPAQTRGQLSPSDRVFGWVPSGRDAEQGNDGASGYRGQLSIRQINCTASNLSRAIFTADSQGSDSGVAIATLSSPKPTQYRFYGSPSQAGDLPKQNSAKEDGYPTSGGLRGRKMYRWQNHNTNHWTPSHEPKESASRKEYQATSIEPKNAKQFTRHKRWVKPGVSFTVELFLDGIHEAELGALIWLLSQGDAAPLRLGAAKPYGFGVLEVTLEDSGIRLHDHRGTQDRWRNLAATPPVQAEQVRALAAKFETQAQAHPVLRDAVSGYLKASAPLPSNARVHYPRCNVSDNGNGYEWFVANEKESNGSRPAWPLPHIQDENQLLPYRLYNPK